jgi:hypothetical protein
MYAVLPSRRQVPRSVSAFLDFATEKIRAPILPGRGRAAK